MAIRLIDSGAQLVSDDQTELTISKGILVASSPSPIEGLIEVRHVGLVRVPSLSMVPVAFLIDLTKEDEKLERLPNPNVIFFLDQPVQRLRLPAFAASTPAKIRVMLSYPGVNDATSRDQSV